MTTIWSSYRGVPLWEVVWCYSVYLVRCFSYSFMLVLVKCSDNKMVKATPHLFHPFIDSALGREPTKKKKKIPLQWSGMAAIPKSTSEKLILLLWLK